MMNSLWSVWAPQDKEAHIHEKKIEKDKERDYVWTLILFFVFNLVDGCVVACSVELFVSSRICFLLWSLLSLRAWVPSVVYSWECFVCWLVVNELCTVGCLTCSFPVVESYISYKTTHNHSCTSVCSNIKLNSFKEICFGVRPGGSAL